MTSNLGAREGATDEEVLAAAQKGFVPELWGRIRNKLVFAPMTQATATIIADKAIGTWCSRLSKEKDLTIHVSIVLRDAIVAQGFNATSGARSLRGVVEHNLYDVLADVILAGE